MVSPTVTVSFTADLAMSLGYAIVDCRLLAEEFGVPVANVHKTGIFLDKRGIDYFVRTPEGRPTVDVKRRRRAYGQLPDNPDLTIELFTHSTPGPLFRDGPLPSHFGFVYNDLPGRVWLFPSHSLRAAAQANRDVWIAEYGLRHAKPTQRADGSSYDSTFVAVPASVVLASLTTSQSAPAYFSI